MKKCVVAILTVLALASSLSAEIITKDKLLSWSTNAGQSGSMKVVAVNGQYVEVEQTNDKNKAAGVIKLYGATLEGGTKLVLINIGQWKEVWEGSVSGNDVTGHLSSGSAKYSFKITGSVAAKGSAFAVGEYQGMHKDWTDKVIFYADGTYKRSVNNDPGTWTYDGKTLVLKWKNWKAETLVQTAPGMFSATGYKFKLQKK